MSRTVSIIVPCRNELRTIRSFIDCIAQQDFTGLGVEVLVADGQSDDGTRDVIQKYALISPYVRFIDNPGRLVSSGLNLALHQATGEIVIRMDVHTYYAPTYVRECVCALVESGAQNVGGPARTSPEGYLGRAIAAAYASAFSCGGARFHETSYEGYVDTVTYGCWWKRTLEELGGFDETLVRNQDDELNLRIIRSGGRIWQTPRIQSWYRPRSSLRTLALQYFQYGYWKVAVIRKHRSVASLRHLVPAAFVVLVVLGLVGTFLHLIDPVHWSGVTKMFLLIATFYWCCNVIACVQTAFSRGLALLPALLIVFPTYHLSYGVGFLAGALSWVSNRKSNCGDGLVGTLSR